MDQAELIEAIRVALRPCAGRLAAAYVFGSVARGTHHDRSDVDLGLLFLEPPAKGLAGMGFDIAALIEPSIGRAVDVVVLNDAPVDLVHRVLRDGVLVLENDPRARIQFEVRSRAQYFDLAPMRQAYRLTKPAGLEKPGGTP